MMTNIFQPTRNEASVDQSHRRDREVAELFDQNYTRLRGLAFVMLGDSALAEEIVMEAFAKACASWRRFSRTDWPPAYLRQMVVNLCRSKIRRQRIESRVNVLTHHAEQVRPPEWEPARSDVQLDLWDAVRKLPERQRACVVLRYLEDLPEAHIAEILQCSIGTVKSQLHRARQGLEKALGADASGGEWA
jgi:RNA polymerase sigma-70 factor (sigma-E family)